MGTWHTDTIDIEDKYGRRVRIAGPGQGEQGYFMAPNSQGLLDDAPVKTIWHKSMFGQTFSGMEWERRELVWTVNIGYNESIDPERDPDEWHALYADWRDMFSYTADTKIWYGNGTEDRLLKARLIEKPKPFSNLQFEGRDPKLWSFGSVVMTMACEIPFYVGKTQMYEWEFSGAGSFSTRLPFFNPSDVPIFPWYEVTDRARWHIPDYSWGSEMYGRGVADLEKVVTTPFLEVGEACEIQTRPDLETYQSENDAPVGLRANGKDFEYPILPGEGVGVTNNNDGATFAASEVVSGGALRVYLPRWYSSPYSRPRLFRAL